MPTIYTYLSKHGSWWVITLYEVYTYIVVFY